LEQCKSNKAIINASLNKSGVPVSVAIVVVFPEMLRYTLWRDMLETKALELLYVQGGSKAADFSIGWFQMKPSFAEKIEQNIIINTGLCLKCKQLVHFTSLLSDTVNIRRERVARLKVFQWQLWYLAAFIAINTARFDSLEIPKENNLKLLAAANNRGMDRSINDLTTFVQTKTFPYGPGYENPFGYVELAKYFYNNNAKPVSFTIGSNFSDTRQGFFKLNENTGDWQLMDIPEAKSNHKIDSLKKRLTILKSEPIIPSSPNCYVCMADIFIGEENRAKIRKSNLKAIANKMKGYGIKSLELNFQYPQVKFKGNKYDMSELLWKSTKEIKIQDWVKKFEPWVYDKKKGCLRYIITENALPDNIHEFSFINSESKEKYILRLEAICYLRYLLRYTPEQLIVHQKKIESEIVLAGQVAGRNPTHRQSQLHPMACPFSFAK
jgi:hypothetical protein